MIKLLRDPAFQGIAAIISIVLTFIAFQASNNQNIGTTVNTLTSPANVGVPLPFDATYEGRWSNPAGSSFSCVFALEIEPDLIVNGQILWTLLTSQFPSYRNRIGMAAVEYVRGRYEPSTGTLEIDGFDRDDPLELISLGNYTLTLNADGSRITGLNYMLGEIDGTFDARRTG